MKLNVPGLLYNLKLFAQYFYQFVLNDKSIKKKKKKSKLKLKCHLLYIYGTVFSTFCCYFPNIG